MEISVAKDFQKKIITSINNENDIVFVSYSSAEETEEKIKFTLAKILEKYQKEILFTPILSCTKELIANATKANAKKVLIDDGIIKDPNDSKDVVRQIRAILNEDSVLEYGLKSKEKELSTRTYIKTYQNNLIIEVINTVPLSEQQQTKINSKIENASKYDNIAEFYMENPDPEAEGMGLGLSMIVVMLKNIDIPHKNFIVSSNKIDKTFAKILIPLN